MEYRDKNKKQENNKSRFSELKRQRRHIEYSKKEREAFKNTSRHEFYYRKISEALEKYPIFQKNIDRKIAQINEQTSESDNIKKVNEQEIKKLEQIKEDINKRFMQYATALRKIEKDHLDLFIVHEKIQFVNEMEKRALTHLDVSEEEAIWDWERKSWGDACKRVQQELPEPNNQDSSEYLNNLADVLQKRKDSLEQIDEKYRQAKYVESTLDAGQDQVQPILRQIHNTYKKLIAIDSQLGIADMIEQGHLMLEEEGQIVWYPTNSKFTLEKDIQGLHGDACQEAHFTLFRDKPSEKQRGLERLRKPQEKFLEALKQLKEIQLLTNALKELLPSTNEGDPVKRLIWKTARSIVATTMEITTLPEEREKHNQTIHDSKEKLQKATDHVNNLKNKHNEVKGKINLLEQEITAFNKEFGSKIEADWLQKELNSTNAFVEQCIKFAVEGAITGKKRETIPDRRADQSKELPNQENHTDLGQLDAFSADLTKHLETLQKVTDQFREVKQTYEWLLNYPDKSSKILDGYRGKKPRENIKWLQDIFAGLNEKREAIKNAHHFDQIEKIKPGLIMANDLLKDRKHDLERIQMLKERPYYD